jgi:hypothetical protein
MTAGQLGAHVVETGDSLAGIVGRYNLSSEMALLEAPANRPLRPVLENSGPLPEGLLVYIPPRAVLLVRDRIYCLQRLRQRLYRHFDSLRESAAADLIPAIRASDLSRVRTEFSVPFRLLEKTVSSMVEEAAEMAWPLVGISQAMVNTHVAEPTDHAVVNAANDPLCPLYWAVTPPMLEFWTDFWSIGRWAKNWQDKDGPRAARLLSQQLNTLGSLVLQQIDKRIRDAQALENRLRFEKRRS